MKKSLFAVTIIGFGLLNGAQQTQTQQITQEGLSYIKQLGATLKSELKKRLQADKTGLEAINFCAEKAQAITAEVNKKLPSHVKVRRTALKVRNLANRPDKTDTEVMQAYATKAEEGKLSPKEIVTVKTEAGYRVYKPLLIQKVCLKCHGKQVAPRITETIKRYYPKDAAMGFKEGDFRGVIVAEIKRK